MSLRGNRGSGQGGGGGQGRGSGQGRGIRNQGNRGLGPGGECVCPSCGHKIPHQRGVPCNQQKCPSCGGMMTR